MRNLIELAVMTTDDAFMLSGIDATVRVVHAYRHETYEEPSSNSWTTLAAHLRVAGDGHMDDVHWKRSLYGADLVHMIAGSRGSCGVGYVGPTSSRMFSISRYSCAVSNFSFGMSSFISLQPVLILHFLLQRMSLPTTWEPTTTEAH